jgi:adenylate cyclase
VLSLDVVTLRRRGGIGADKDCGRADNEHPSVDVARQPAARAPGPSFHRAQAAPRGGAPPGVPRVNTSGTRVLKSLLQQSDRLERLLRSRRERTRVLILELAVDLLVAFLDQVEELQATVGACRLQEQARNHQNQAVDFAGAVGMEPYASEGLEWADARRLRCAIVVIDVVESVRLMRRDDGPIIDRWRHFVHDVRHDLLPEHGGRLIKSLGDGLLLTFNSVRSALACARAMLARLAHVADAQPSDSPQIRIRIGIHFAEVVVDDLDIYGAAVNLASRLTGLAGPDEIVASPEVVDEIAAGIDADIDDLGECYLKHLDDPVRAYRLALPTREDGDSGGWLVSSPRDLGTHPELPRPKVAVLTLSGNGSTLLQMLIADEVAAQLSAHSTVDVVSRMSTRETHGLERDTLLARLGTNYAVGGSCTLIEQKVFLTLELTFVSDQHVVWTRTTQGAIEQVIADPGSFVTASSSEIMEAIEAHETGRARSLPLPSLASYSLLIGGVRLMHRLSRSDFDRAREVLEALTVRHPRHPDGYAWLAKWNILQVHQGWSSDVGRSSSIARDLARRALDHDDRCGVAMVITGMVKTFNDRRLDDAESIYRAALDANPNDSLAWLLKGTLHAFRGEGEEAVAHARRGSDLSPLDPMRYYFDSLTASAEASAGNYERAIVLAQRSLRANVMHASTLRILTIAYAMLDRIGEARQMAQRIFALEPGFTVERFLARSPSSDFPIGRTFADALARAGVPYH